MLINKSHPQPATKKAPAGGKRMVTRMRITSEALTDIVVCVWMWKGVAEWSWVFGVAAVAAEITVGPGIGTHRFDQRSLPKCPC